MATSRIETLTADRIVADPKFQTRAAGIDPDRVEMLAGVLEAGGRFKDRPVVFEESDHSLILADGFTRHAAAKKTRKPVEWEVRPGGRRAAFQHCLRANEDHGQPRTKADRVNAVRMALADPETLAACTTQGKPSARKLAAVLGFNASYCAELLREATGAAKREDMVRANPGKKSEPSAGEPALKPKPKGDDERGDHQLAGGDNRERDDGGRDPGRGVTGSGSGGVQVGGVDGRGGEGGGGIVRGGVLRDRFGRPVPDHLTAVFKDFAPAVKAEADRIGAAVKNAKKLSDDPVAGGFLARLPGWADSLAEERERLLGAVPFAVCPACGGSGDTGECPTCWGAGWLPAAAVIDLPEHLAEEMKRHGPGDAFEPDLDGLPERPSNWRTFEPAGPNLDGLGKPIPGRLRDAFAGDDFLAETARKLKKMGTQLKAASAWNPHIQPAVWVSCERAADDTEAARPFAVCGDCRGKGCVECHTAGYLPAWQKDNLLAGQ